CDHYSATFAPVDFLALPASMLSVYFSFYGSRAPRLLHSFPTRRSSDLPALHARLCHPARLRSRLDRRADRAGHELRGGPGHPQRSEEHTSELQSRFDLVCRLLLEKKKKTSSSPCRCDSRGRATGVAAGP